MFSRIKNILSLYKEVRYLAYHDSLTGLLNRNWLHKNINKLRFKYVYFIDINDLNLINKHGHTMGDKHILKCVKEIYKIIENKDVFIRYAGDEFILLSQKDNLLKTNNLFSVGKSRIIASIQNAIEYADLEMIKEKSNWKSNGCDCGQMSCPTCHG